MSKVFTEVEKEIISQVGKYADEFTDDIRKGMSQIKYVIEVPENSTWDDWENQHTDIPVPKELVGNWLMAENTCEQYGLQSWEEALNAEYMGWDKCKEVEVVKKQWEKL